MPSIEARHKPAHADADTSPAKADRRSADAVFLSTANFTSELSRVNSTPLSSDAVDSLGLPSSSSSPSTNDSHIDASPLTMAPPKPGPADTLYPSPSGGFVPSPEEGQDWRLKSPPPGRNTKDSATLTSRTLTTAPAIAATVTCSSSPSSASRALPPPSEASSHRPLSGLSPTVASSVTTPTRPPSLPACPETASKIANAASNSLSRRSSQASNAVASPQLRPVSSSASSRSRLSTAASSSQLALPASAAAAASQSAATASDTQQSHDSAPDRSATSSRPNSTASFQTARNDDAQHDSTCSIRIRDFAYPEYDPRYHGLPLTEPLESAQHDQHSQEPGQEPDTDDQEFYIEGPEDENEFDGDQGDDANVPEGIYNVLYAFEPVSEHELAVGPGDTVHVVGSIDGGWAIAIKDGDDSVKGLVPATYLEWSAPLPE